MGKTELTLKQRIERYPSLMDESNPMDKGNYS